MNKKRLINLLIGPLLLILLVNILPSSVFTTFASRAAIGTVAWMAYWWVMSPVDYAVTAFLPIAVNAILQMTDMSAVIANYASETILLLLGASILTVSWEMTGLDKRIAAVFLRLVGSNFRTQIVFWFVLCTILSAVLPNAVVCATITPIAVSMLNYIGEGDISNSKIGSKLLLTIAYAAGLGGLASPLGGAMNLVTVDYIQQLTGEEYMYTSWVVRFLPIMLVLLALPAGTSGIKAGICIYHMCSLFFPDHRQGRRTSDDLEVRTDKDHLGADLHLCRRSCSRNPDQGLRCGRCDRNTGSGDEPQWRSIYCICYCNGYTSDV